MYRGEKYPYCFSAREILDHIDDILLYHHDFVAS